MFPSHWSLKSLVSLILGRAGQGSVGGREEELTLDFLLRQAMQAVLTHRLLADVAAEVSLSLSLLKWDLDLIDLGLGLGLELDSELVGEGKC